MDTVRIDRKNVKIIAHRGLSGLEKENTCAAFVAAGNRSYWGVETDVRKTKDGKFVLMHDEDTVRVSGGKHNLKIEESTAEEIAAVTLPDTDGDYTRHDLRIPTLRDYIRICKKYNKTCVLELKKCFVEEDIKNIVDEIEDLGYINNTVFISFSLELCVVVRRIHKGAEIQWLADREATPEIMDTVTLNHIDLDIYYPRLTRELVDYIHSLGLRVNCWTCDRAEDAQRLIEWGVDYITTNILE